MSWGDSHRLDINCVKVILRVLGGELSGAYVIIKSLLNLHGPLIRVRDPELLLPQS